MSIYVFGLETNIEMFVNLVCKAFIDVLEIFVQMLYFLLPMFRLCAIQL